MGMGAGSQWSSMRFCRCAQISALLLAGSVLALTPRWTAMLLMDCNVAVLERHVARVAHGRAPCGPLGIHSGARRTSRRRSCRICPCPGAASQAPDVHALRSWGSFVEQKHIKRRNQVVPVVLDEPPRAQRHAEGAGTGAHGTEGARPSQREHSHQSTHHHQGHRHTHTAHDAHPAGSRPQAHTARNKH